MQRKLLDVCMTAKGLQTCKSSASNLHKISITTHYHSVQMYKGEVPICGPLCLSRNLQRNCGPQPCRIGQRRTRVGGGGQWGNRSKYTPNYQKPQNKLEAQWPIGYGVGLRIKRSSVRIRPWPPALSPWTRLFTPIVPRRTLHISFY